MIWLSPEIHNILLLHFKIDLWVGYYAWERLVQTYNSECKNLFCSFWGGIRISILYISETGIKGLPYSLLETYDGFWKE